MDGKIIRVKILSFKIKVMFKFRLIKWKVVQVLKSLEMTFNKSLSPQNLA